LASTVFFDPRLLTVADLEHGETEERWFSVGARQERRLAKLMNDRPIDDNDMPGEIDFSKGVRGLHHVPAGAKVLMPVSIERGVWEYFSGKAEQRGVDLPSS